MGILANLTSATAQEWTGIDLRRQADFMRQQHAPFSARVMDAAAIHLPQAPFCLSMFEGWSGDRRSAALPLRLLAGLHNLARRGVVPELSAAFATLDPDCEQAVALALATGDAMIAPWLMRPTQTNEVARSAATMAALRVVAGRFRLPIHLHEMGASAGLNLLLDGYAFDLGGVRAGDPASPLVIRPRWSGQAPRGAQPTIVQACGVDRTPLDFRDPGDCERLFSYVWPDRAERLRRLRLAIQLARHRTVDLQAGSAVEWLRDKLAAPRTGGVVQCIVHTMFHQYLGDEDKADVEAIFAEAGAAATEAAPLARISLEWTPSRSVVELVLTTWPTGTREVLAHAHPYGAWIRWLGD
ncbi:DUF2332 domain-containing protein [Novosphingobium olei]|uniref:DUF2332 family protein n=1 Tax=Novosphingobium olei TaxID=2728851 RepID=A0A7Y0BRG5_9SPHN|nr:DUF2332 family protein [Novosphingobium olei]NML94945.1 DUF2332 family protein [Novosphingobium olei]BEV00432.1 DUF2332 family protein [Novosphingobium olei]